MPSGGGWPKVGLAPASGGPAIGPSRPLLFVLALVLAGPATAAPCRPAPLATLTARVSAAETVLVPVTLDGRPTQFQLDTGADMSLVSLALARALGLPRSMAATPLLVGASGRPIREWTTAHSLEIGGLARGPSFLAVVPDTAIADGEAQGLLGANYLSAWDVELDLAAGRIALYAPAPCADGGIAWPRRPSAVRIEVGAKGRALLPMTLDGTRVRALLDTGASRTVMALATARRLYGIAPDSPGLRPQTEMRTSDGGALTTFRKTFSSLSLGGISFRNPDIDLIEMRVPPGQEPPFDLILGVEHLRQLHLLIAYRERMLYAVTVP